VTEYNLEHRSRCQARVLCSVSWRVRLPPLTYSARNELTVGYRDKPPWRHGGFFRRNASFRNHFRRRLSPALSHPFPRATPALRLRIALRAPKSRTLCRAPCLGLTIGRLRLSETDTAVSVSLERSQLFEMGRHRVAAAGSGFRCSPKTQAPSVTYAVRERHCARFSDFSTVHIGR
jgi:hypothetical protein